MADRNNRNFLLRATLLLDDVPDRGAFPFTIPAIGALETLSFEQPVTFLIGDSGAGKSTLLGAIAVALDLNAEGGIQNLDRVWPEAAVPILGRTSRKRTRSSNKSTTALKPELTQTAAFSSRARAQRSKPAKV